MLEITNALRKTIKSLGDARHRRETGLFVAEGTKCVLDTMRAFDVRSLFATPSWIKAFGDQCGGLPVTEATKADLERMTQLSTAPQVIGLYRIPADEASALKNIFDESHGLVLALDRVQDPGNLGTIVRVADWMGVRHILASGDTVDVYNPKVVQSTMGSIARVKVHYVPDLPATLATLAAGGAEIYGTLLDDHATDLYTSSFTTPSVLVMGNEGQGISADVQRTLTKRIFIPPYPADAQTAESLNVAVATAIVLSHARHG